MAKYSQLLNVAENLTHEIEKYVGDINPDSKKGRKRLSILQAAITMFAKSGYRQTSMDELANEVGVAKGTLYLYFPKKIDLLFACAAYEKLRWVPQLSAILAGDAPAADRLKQWIVAVLLLPSRSPLMLRLLEDGEMAAMLADCPPELISDSEHKSQELLQPLLDEVAGAHRWSAHELRDRVNVIGALGHIAPVLRHESLRPGMSPERFAAILADLVVDGLRPRPEAEQPS
jgi:AcrR family transcriptional regulator